MAPPSLSYTFGPGPLTPAVRALVAANVIGFVLTLAFPSLTIYLGLIPALVLERGWIWQPVTYMFQHGGMFHLLFNMLALWMFG
ncbi:MAG: rhomboid family intramembrane serine protease, partial [Acidobacteria bacterium]|nr:rhomboid family intramembrane serine protease [Acidobacteriota bacterium]